MRWLVPDAALRINITGFERWRAYGWSQYTMDRRGLLVIKRLDLRVPITRELIEDVWL